MKVRIEVNAKDDKIHAIKILREATGKGLKEAKDVCDVVFNKYTSSFFVMNEAQFGIFTAYCAKYPNGLSVGVIEIMSLPRDFDFTESS